MTSDQLESQPALQLASVLPDASDSALSETLLRPEKQSNTARVMIVDDEPIIIKVLQKYLRQAGYENFITTSDSRDAVELIRKNRPDVVVLDIIMPHVTGLNILEVLRGDRSLCHLPVVILSAATDDEVKQRALELGATDFLTKPVKPPELITRIRNALVIKAHHDHLTNYSKRLEHEVRQRTEELSQSWRELIHVLASAAEYRDEVTGNHILRVGRYAGIIARQLKIPEAHAELIEQAAILHDVGKIGISDAILLKPGKLDPSEIALMQVHCQYGENILRCISSQGRRPRRWNTMAHECHSPILRVAATIAISHHEKWDGSGYPHGLSGESIPIEGRITAVADVFDALCGRRPYKQPLPLLKCLDILEQGRGQHFDPKVLDAFLACTDEVFRVAIELADEDLQLE